MHRFGTGQRWSARGLCAATPAPFSAFSSAMTSLYQDRAMPLSGRNIICSTMLRQVICSTMAQQVICSTMLQRIICSTMFQQVICSTMAQQVICLTMFQRVIRSTMLQQVICAPMFQQVICSTILQQLICSTMTQQVICSTMFQQIICSTMPRLVLFQATYDLQTRVTMTKRFWYRYQSAAITSYPLQILDIFVLLLKLSGSKWRLQRLSQRADQPTFGRLKIILDG